MNATPPVHALSFDVEEHFQVANFADRFPRERWDLEASRVEDNVDVILDLCSRHRVQATFFTLGWVAERHKAMIRRIVDAGHELASHGYDHQFVYHLGERGFREDIQKTKQILEDAGGVEVIGFRASTFTITEKTPWALDLLAETGHRYDASIFPVRHPAYGVPSAPRNIHKKALASGRSMIEFPPLTLRYFGRNYGAGGGGYFRLFPYAYTAHAFRRAGREGLRGSLYLHPWEFDPEQPRVDVSFLKRVRHYRNITNTLRRLERLITEFQFTTMRGAIELELGADIFQ